MRRYTQVSAVVFTFIAGMQATRAILQWPVRVADVDVPVWVSVIAALIAGSLAIWAFRGSTRGSST